MNFGKIRLTYHPMNSPRFLVALFAVALGATVGKADDITLGLVDHYQFNGSLNNSSGNGFNLTGSGTFNYVTGYDGTANGAVQLGTAATFLGNGPNLVRTCNIPLN